MSATVFRVQQVQNSQDLVDAFAFFRKGVQTEVQRDLLRSYQVPQEGMLPPPLPPVLLFVRSRNRHVIGVATLMVEHCPQRGIVGTIRFHTKIKDITRYEELRGVLLADACEKLFAMGVQSIFLELEKIPNMALVTHLRRAYFQTQKPGKTFRFHKPLEEE
jgi:hypothetical protein